MPLLRDLPLRWEGHARTRYSRRADVPGLAGQTAWYDAVLLRLADELPGLRISPGIAGLAFDLSGYPDPTAWCPLGQSLVFNARGEAFPCALFMNPADRLGDARRVGLEHFEASPKRACAWKQFCQAGCPGIAVQQFGTTERPDAFCAYRKKRYETILFDLVERREKQLGRLAGYEGF